MTWVEELISKPSSKGKIFFSWLGYSSIALKIDDKTVLIDPADLISIRQLKTLKPDLILYTHEHYDHFYLPIAVEAVKLDIPVGCNLGCHEALKGKVPEGAIALIKPGMEVEILSLIHI